MFIPFDSEGHHFIGKSIRSIIGINKDQLRLTNGAVVSSADLMMLFGDYYGVAKEPISEGNDETERERRFLNAFDTIDKQANPEDIYALVDMVKKGREAIEKAIKNNESTVEVIDSCAGHETLEAIIHTKGQYIKLAKYNIDHFGESAKIAYRTGHVLALKLAAAAYEESMPSKKQQLLDRAIMIESCACHFLTDLFSSGHMQTPRLALHQRFGSTIGGLLSLFMHNEDGDNGLDVMDKEDNAWFARGDGHLFAADATANLNRVKTAVTVALEEVKNAFDTGKVAPTETLRVFQLIPSVASRSTTPLYIIDDNHELLCREQLHNLTCQTYSPLTATRAFEVLHYFAEQAIIKQNQQLIKKLEHGMLKIQNKFLLPLQATDKDQQPDAPTKLAQVGFFHHPTQPTQAKSHQSHCCLTL